MLNNLRSPNNIRVVDKYQFNQSDIAYYNHIKEVHAVHCETKEEYTLRSIELNGKSQHIYDYMQQELTILKWLNHPSIVQCHRIFKTRNHLYFIFDNVPGYPLSELLQGSTTFRRVIEIIGGLLNVLGYLHQRDVIHGQLDPSSIILFGGSKLKLRNFGYGVHIVKEPMPLPNFHSHRDFNHYTPPEAYQMTLNFKSDVYSLGCIISALLQSIRGATDRQNEFSIHIGHFAEKMQVKLPEQRLDIQDVIEYFRTQPYEKKIKTIKMPSMKKRSTNTEHNAAKLKLRQFPNNQVTPVLLDCSRQARKLLAKRNFQKFLFEIARLCGSLPLEAMRSLSLGLVLTKKAVVLAGQLLKLLQTGSGDTLKIDERTLNRINRYTLFIELEAMISRQKQELQELFDLLSKGIKEKLKKQENPEIFRQLTVELVDANFLKKCLYSWLGDAIEWLKQQTVRPPKKDLVLLCVLIFLIEFPSLEEGFSILCGDNGVEMWQQPLFQELEQMSDYNLQRLIVLEGEGKGLSEDTLSSGGSSKVKEKSPSR